MICGGKPLLSTHETKVMPPIASNSSEEGVCFRRFLSCTLRGCFLPSLFIFGLVEIDTNLSGSLVNLLLPGSLLAGDSGAVLSDVLRSVCILHIP